MPDLTPEEIVQLVGRENIAKLYNDSISEPAKEFGKSLSDIVKTMRLFLAPFQIAAAYQDKLSKYLEDVRNSVPDQNQIDCDPQIAAPVLEKLKFVKDESYLKELYLNLLRRAIDKERVNEAHPAFVIIIDQLSSDEAIMIDKLAKSEYNGSLEYKKQTIVEVGALPEAELINVNNLSTELLTFPENIELYVNHLRYLNIIELVEYTVGAPDQSDQHKPATFFNIVHLTKFGQLFYNACVK